MKWLWIAVGVLLGVFALAYGAGLLLPEHHVAIVEATYHQPAERVYAAIEDVQAGTAWRSGLSRVEVLSHTGAPLRWREHTSFGTIVFRREAAVAPVRIVSVIDDTSEGFGGRWIYEISSAADSTTLRITEEGDVYSPLFRFMSRFIFGHYRTLEQYARDLGHHFGEEVTPIRVPLRST